MKHDVFIVHADKDRSIADAICQKLESAGLRYWISARETSAGDEEMKEILNAIECSQVIVVILSANANADPAIKRKIVHAHYTQRHIIPFRVGATIPRGEFLFYLGSASWFNAVYPPAEEHLEALKDRIKELIHKTGSAVPAFAPEDAAIKRLSPDAPGAWTGVVNSPRRRSFGLLKWVSIATILCSVGWAVWFTLRSQKDGKSLALTHRQFPDRLDLSPTPTRDSDGNAPEPKMTNDD